MRLIDADALRKCVMKWLPKDPCGIEEKEFPFETDICVSMLMEIDEQPTIEPQKWIPFHKRELTEEEQEMYPEWSYYLDCELPEDGEEILISSPTWGVYKDTFNNEGSDGCYLEGDEEIDDGMAWMPLPEPYKEEEE